MSMLSSQADELRGYALSVRNVALRMTSLCHEARRDLLDSAVRMEQAADTIENLRDRLQESYGKVPEQVKHENDSERESCGTRWHELFGTPERAARTLQALDPHTRCRDCAFGDSCDDDDGCIYERDYDALLEWLRGDAE